MAKHPTAADANRASFSTPSWHSASQSFILSERDRCLIIDRSGTMLHKASVAARLTSGWSLNWRYSKAWTPFSTATRLLAVAPKLNKFVRASNCSKTAKSVALTWRHAQSNGRMAHNCWSSVNFRGSVVMSTLPAAWAADNRHLSSFLSLFARLTADRNPPCWISVPLISTSVAKAQSASANFDAVSEEGFEDASVAIATTPSLMHSFRARALAKSGVSLSASSGSFCFVMRMNSSYCSGLISISFSRKCLLRSSSFVTVKLASIKASP